MCASPDWRSWQNTNLEWETSLSPEASQDEVFPIVPVAASSVEAESAILATCVHLTLSVPLEDGEGD